MSRGMAIGIAIVLATGFLITATVPEKANAATERNWITLGQDYNETEFASATYVRTIEGYIKVVPGEIININYKSGEFKPLYQSVWISGIDYSYWTPGNAYIYVQPTNPPINYSASYNYSEYSGSDVYINRIGVFVDNTTKSTPQSAWMRCSSYDVIAIKMQLFGNISSYVVFNITLTSDEWTLENNTKIYQQLESLTTQISRLNDSLNATINSLNASVTNLSLAFLANLSIVNEALYNLNTTIQELRNYTEELNLSIWENLTVDLANIWTELINLNMSERIDIATMKTQIQTVNASLTQVIEQLQLLVGANDTALLNKLTELSGLMGIINSTLSNRISNIPSYNDSTVWDEIGRLKKELANASLNTTNLTTLVNQTMVNQTLINQTLVNRTEVNPMTYINTTKPSNEGVVIGATVGGITGVVSGLGSSILFHRRRSGYRPELINREGKAR